MSAGSDPSAKWAAVTPSDSTSLTGVRGLYVGTGGDVVVQPQGVASSITFANVPSGTFMPIRPGKVMAATTASDIVSLQ